MAHSYTATGINLRAAPLGEADRLMTILTKEQGLIRAIAPGARRQKSSLSGRSALFVVNELLIVQGRALPKITQAETQESFAGLSLDFRKLTAGQYLAELALLQALSDQPQAELFYLLTEHLGRIARSQPSLTLPHLAHGIYQLLALGGVAPQVQQCCLNAQRLEPELGNPVWRAAFSPEFGGAISLDAWSQLKAKAAGKWLEYPPESSAGIQRTREAPMQIQGQKRSKITPIGAVQLWVMQQLACADLPHISPDWLPPGISIDLAWLSIERLLRTSACYHFDRQIRSATLIDQAFTRAPGT